MKRNLILLFSLMLSAWVSAQQLYVGSYNIRYRNNEDSIAGNVWSKRCQVICDLINFEHPDIFGAQEVLHGQLQDMKHSLDHYDYIGVGRDDGKQAGEYAAIFYDTRSLTLLDEGHFWLSPTPSRPGLGWDAACVRICTWGKFLDKRTRKQFFFFNVHMDHVGVVARREGAKLIISRIRQMATACALSKTEPSTILIPTASRQAASTMYLSRLPFLSTAMASSPTAIGPPTRLRELKKRPTRRSAAIRRTIIPYSSIS